VIGGVLPALLAGLALGLALAFGTRRMRLVGLAALTLAAGAARLIVPPIIASETLLLLSSLAILLASGIGLFARPLRLAVVAPLGTFVGGVIGMTASEGNDLSLLGVAVALVLATPAAWLALRRERIVLRVAASWLFTVALLVTVIPLVTTPGYAPDHME